MVSLSFTIFFVSFLVFLRCLSFFPVLDLLGLAELLLQSGNGGGIGVSIETVEGELSALFTSGSGGIIEIGWTVGIGVVVVVVVFVIVVVVLDGEMIVFERVPS